MTDLEAIDANFAGGCSCRSDVVGCALHRDNAPSAEVVVAEPLFDPQQTYAPATPKRRRWNEAIPTTYGGVNFRSRLEARWAAFFDLVAWPWQYEPLDLDGYIPDFILGFHRPLLVEVKPIVAWPPNEATLAQLAKVQASGWDGEAIVVGAYPLATEQKTFSIGRFLLERATAESVVSDSWSEAHPLMCLECERLSLTSSAALRCRVAGCSGAIDVDRGALMIVQLWREAGNRVQWRRRA